MNKTFREYYEKSSITTGIENLLDSSGIDEKKVADYKAIFNKAEAFAKEKGLVNPYQYAYGAVKRAIANSKK